MWLSAEEKASREVLLVHLVYVVVLGSSGEPLLRVVAEVVHSSPSVAIPTAKR